MRACAGKQWLPDSERTAWENKRKKSKENKAEEEFLRIGEEPKEIKAPKPVKRKPRAKKEVSQFSSQVLQLFAADL